MLKFPRKQDATIGNPAAGVNRPSRPGGGIRCLREAATADQFLDEPVHREAAPAALQDTDVQHDGHRAIRMHRFQDACDIERQAATSAKIR
jgi:hypothetical protein